MSNIINSISNSFNSKYNTASDNVQTGYNTSSNNIQTGYNTSSNNVQPEYYKSKNGVLYKYDKSSDRIVYDYNNTVNDIQNGFNDTINSIQNEFNNTVNDIQNGYNNTTNNIQTGYDNTINGIEHTYNDLTNSANDDISATQNDVKKITQKSYIFLTLILIIFIIIMVYFFQNKNYNNFQPEQSNANIFSTMNNPSIQIILSLFILFFSVVLILTTFNKSFLITKSKEELVGNLLIMLTCSVIFFGVCLMILPGLKDLRTMFEQINSVTYIIIYTIFAILFYSLMPSDVVNNYATPINVIMLVLGGFFYYKGFSQNYFESFNPNYEKIKMIIIFVCLITSIILFYVTNPGNIVEKYSNYTFIISFIIVVFSFLYVLITVAIGNKSNVGIFGTTLFVLFLSIMVGYILINKNELSENHAKLSSILILVLLLSILSSLLISLKAFSDPNSNGLNSSAYNIYKKSLLGVFGLVISAMLIYWIVYNVENLSNKSSITSFVLSFLLISIILGLVYKTIYVKFPAHNNKKNAFFNLILSTLFYIPCIFNKTFDWLGKMTAGEYNGSNAGSFMMLLVAISLLVAYFKIPSIFNLVSTQGGKQLVNKPVYTNTIYNLGNYQELNGSDEFDYQYAISCWIYIDAAAPNMNSNYKKFTSLLNFGNKPNILYNPSKNRLMITMKQKDLKNITKNKLIDFDDDGNRIIYTNDNFLLQKWNNVIINYSGGTLDIFLNGELVKSSIEVVPYLTYDNLTIGEDDGIKGGICNVVYFRHALTSTNVYYLYNSLKTRSPPTLNDSNETIMVKNINTTMNSIS